MRNRLWGAALAGTLCATVAATAAAPVVSDQVKIGVDAWEAGNYTKAVQSWRPLAERGDADAQFNLAQAYRLGRGGPIDMKAAESWYQKAAAQDHYQAQANYGLLLFQGGRRGEAMPWLEKAANKGDPRAQYVVGTALFNGDPLPKDWVRGYALMTRASAAGLPPAATSLGEMDRYLSLEQRQKGTAMARELERSAQAAQAAPAPMPGPGTVYAGGAPNGAVRPLDLPPSAPRTPGRPVTKPTVNAPAPVPARADPAPKPVAAAPSPAGRPLPAAAPAPRAPAASAGGKWRVQLGAFSSQAAAQAQWGTIRGRAGLGGLQPFYVDAGKVVRLQAGPFASKAAADKACAAAKGIACFAAAAP